MSLSSLNGVDFNSYFKTPSIASELPVTTDSLVIDGGKDNTVFGSILDSAVNLVSETNAYSNAAEEEEIKFALGETDSIHDVQIAQQKANVSLQYTVAVRDAVMSAYKELLNLQM